MKKKLQLITIVLLSILSLGIFIGSACAATSGIQAYGLDTKAGNETYLRSSTIAPNTSINFYVQTANGENLFIPAVSNESGIAMATLSSEKTKVAGRYIVSADYISSPTNSEKNYFNVFAGDLSESVSEIYPTEQLANTYGDKASIKVVLKDGYGNPVSGHQVKLISSSSLDLVETVNQVSNEQGVCEFYVSSSSQGVSTFTPLDLTSNKQLSKSATVVFFNDNSYVSTANLPQDYMYAANGSATDLDHFLFENLPSQINVGESVTFTLSAKDSTETTVDSYEGTVRFSVISDNYNYVNLPDDYTFTASDLGSHTFSLALTFLQEGTYRIEARDISDIEIYGEHEFVVGSSEGPPLPSSGITLSTPIAGTSSESIQSISGTTTPGAKLKIYDNEIEIANLVADTNGNFSHTTSLLTDGEHIFYVATVNDVGTIIETSSEVTVNIDTSSPEISEVKIEPSNVVEPGSIFVVKLYVNDDLSQAALIFEENVFDLVRNEAGYYEASFAAPNEPGDYPLGFNLVDQLGNESRIDNASNITVGQAAVQEVPIGDVSNLYASPEDHRVILTWNAPDKALNGIKNYRLYYGLSPNQLTEAVDTFDYKTTWYIPNLKNGVEYYFAAVAVDELGNISEHFSNIVKTTPNPVVSDTPDPDVMNGSAGGEALDDMTEDPSESGPEVLWLLIPSVFGGYFYIRTSKRVI